MQSLESWRLGCFFFRELYRDLARKKVPAGQNHAFYQLEQQEGVEELSYVGQHRGRTQEEYDPTDQQLERRFLSPNLCTGLGLYGCFDKRRCVGVILQEGSLAFRLRLHAFKNGARITLPLHRAGPLNSQIQST